MAKSEANLHHYIILGDNDIVCAFGQPASVIFAKFPSTSKADPVQNDVMAEFLPVEYMH